MAIEWNYLIAEMTLLAVIIYGATYVENWIDKRKLSREKRESAQQIIKFVTNDLKKKLTFIEDSLQYKDYNLFSRTCGMPSY